MNKYRYENKYIIDGVTATMLKMQLRPLMQLDSHSLNEEVSYHIRSMYFDDLDNSAFFEKVDGIEFRKKYRMRMYNGDSKAIFMECKYKDENMTAKANCHLTKINAEHILKGNYQAVKLKNEFLHEFFRDAKLMNLKPSILVDYTRLVYIYPLSDVRITFDEQLKSGGGSLDFFSKDLPRADCLAQGQTVLEVKYNEFLPNHIQSILNQYNLNLTAISKFATCCLYK